MSKVLIVNEFHKLNTGYSNYGEALLWGLSRIGDHEIAELACYAEPQEAANTNVPWRVYPGVPGKQEIDDYKSNPRAVFGEFMFERTCLHFQPDVVIAFRDFWMDNFINQSTYRNHFRHILMPACDATPQNEQWLCAYSEADACFSYSDWGASVLNQESGGKIRVLGSASPSALPQYMVTGQEQAKKALSINSSWDIIGTVMRNQRRKLYPDLFLAFRDFLDKTGKNNSYLYCHTSYPDHGWDFPFLLKHYNIGSRVLFTYLCKNPECQHIEASLFSDAVKICPKCWQMSLAFPDVKKGLSHEQMAIVYNSMDLYIQYSNCMPAGQKVLLKSGWTNIEEVKVGDLAYSHTGKWQKVKETFKKLNNNNVYEISVHGDFERIKLTAEHPVFAITAKNYNYNKTCKSFREQLGCLLRTNQKLPEPKFVDTKDLLPGDLIAYPINKNIVDVEKIDLIEYCGDGYIVSDNDYRYKSSTVSHNRHISVDLDFCKWLGLFVADGNWNTSNSAGEIRVTSHVKEKNNHDLCLNVMSNFGNVFRRPYKDRNGVDYSVSNKVLANWTSSQCLKHELKKLPDWIMELPLDKQKAILQGLFMGDGCYQENRQVSIYNTISKVLSFQIKEIMRRLGIVYNMNLVFKKGNRKPQYRFEVSGNVKAGEFSSERSNTSSLNTGDYYLYKIKSNDIVNEKIDYVYNFEVENDNSYCSLLGSVHNSEGCGIPQIESLACGVPIASVNYSAMCDFVNKCDSYPIEPIAFYTELETGCKRAVPNNSQLVSVLEEFYTLSPEEIARKRVRSRELFEKHFNIRDVINKWNSAISAMEKPKLPWDSEPRIFNPSTDVPSGLNTVEFVKWCIKHVLCQQEKIGSYLESRMIRDINYGFSFTGNPEVYFNEDSNGFQKPVFSEFNREKCMQFMLYMRHKHNKNEQIRAKILCGK